MTSRASRVSVGLCLLLALGALATSGCADPPRVEKKGSTTQKLLAPDPLMKVKASHETHAAYDIDEWRFYRGRGSLFVTGYNSAGKAIKGIGALVGRGNGGSISALQLQINNGSRAAVVLAPKMLAVNNPVSLDSQAFLRRATLDFARVGVAADLRRRLAGNANAADFCGSAIPNAFTSLALCIAKAGNNATAVQRCQIAAQLLEQSRLNCHGLASPTGGVIDPLPVGINIAGLPSICQGDPTGMCGRDMTLLQQEELFGVGCGNDFACQAGGFGFDPLGPPGTTGGNLAARPNIGNLITGQGITTGTCLTGNCGIDTPPNFQCIAGDCAAFQGGTPSFQCIAGDCAALKGGTTTFPPVQGFGDDPPINGGGIWPGTDQPGVNAFPPVQGFGDEPPINGGGIVPGTDQPGVNAFPPVQGFGDEPPINGGGIWPGTDQPGVNAFPPVQGFGDDPPLQQNFNTGATDFANFNSNMPVLTDLPEAPTGYDI